ncbi:EF-hand domain-containing protein [Paraglaciecola sp. L1A13]|uniref:EF-hand domain-containing protein n=1 Tax=Paraglaciecola sp. L1A13 TaxID=2686359 RepID=UPI00131AD5A7|nr:EF-hand domain-containing protein [Paraglaciecola sp. L1A13]
MKNLIAITCLCFASGSAFAQEDIMDALDADNDGRISVEEASSDAALSSVFTELDVNKDGYLSASELES